MVTMATRDVKGELTEVLCNGCIPAIVWQPWSDGKTVKISIYCS